MKVLLFSRYAEKGASSRVRSFQYLPFLRKNGFTVSVSPLFSNDYLDALYANRTRFFEVARGYLQRIITLTSVFQYDLLIIEKELFPYMPAIFERLLHFIGIPYLADYDDALFHRYDCHKSRWVRLLLGKKIDTVMKNAATVIAGNRYLADRAENAGAVKTVIIPTVVDTDEYLPVQPDASRKEVVIGWIGTPKTSHYLMPLLPVFARLKSQLDIRFVAIGAKKEDFLGTPVEVWPWSQDTEVASIQQLDIGIMPLQDSEWERGKCGYKLIQYMACGRPVVASPVGVNCEIVKDDGNGFLASTEDEWEARLTTLCRSIDTRKRMGLAARKTVEMSYSTQVQQDCFLSAIEQAAHQYD